MSNNNNGSGGGFSQGFIVGVVVGAALVFFFGTKKGKKLLSAFLENGLGGLSDLEEFMGEDLPEDGYDDTQKDLDESDSNETSKVSSNHPNGESSSKKPTTHRFFKGVPRRV